MREARLAHDGGGIETLRCALEAAWEAGLAAEELAAAAELLAKLESEQLLLTFTDVSREDVEALEVSQCKEDVVGILMRCMGLSLDDGFRTEIALEMPQWPVHLSDTKLRFVH